METIQCCWQISSGGTDNGEELLKTNVCTGVSINNDMSEGRSEKKWIESQKATGCAQLGASSGVLSCRPLFLERPRRRDLCPYGVRLGKSIDAPRKSGLCNSGVMLSAYLMMICMPVQQKAPRGSTS